MTRRLIARVSALALFILLAWIAYTQNQTQPAKLTINKVKDGLYEIEGDGGNVAVLVTSEGVILASVAAGRRLMEIDPEYTYCIVQRRQQYTASRPYSTAMIGYSKGSRSNSKGGRMNRPVRPRDHDQV